MLIPGRGTDINTFGKALTQIFLEVKVYGYRKYYSESIVIMLVKTGRLLGLLQLLDRQLSSQSSSKRYQMTRS